MSSAARPSQRALRRHWLTGVALASMILMVGCQASETPSDPAPSGAASHPAPSGWSTVWSDDFTGGKGTAPGKANWQYDIGTHYPGGADHWGTREIETMTDSTANVALDGKGNLAITPIRDDDGNWTSGRIETRRSDFRPDAGGILRFESRLQLPNVTGEAAQGLWPAFWAVGAPFRGVHTNWPSIGEIDVLENINGNNEVLGTLHCGVSPGGPCNEQIGLGGKRVMGSPSLQTAFHTYAVEWDRSTSPEELRWYVDGTQYHRVTASQVGADTWREATSHGYYVILNVAIGGGLPGDPTDATTSGVPMRVDYVTVFKRR
jgi:beta-glucanase (GH16 family)